MHATLMIQEEAIPIVRSSLEMKRKALEHNLLAYQTQLSAFEQAHRMTSEGFMEKYNAGELGDNAEWFEWEFVLDAHRETSRQLKLLESVRL